MPLLIPSLIPQNHPLNHRHYFFDKGIYFECRQCGKCCVGDPGVVRVSDEEISAMAHFLNLRIKTFKTSCLYRYKGEFLVYEHKDGRCLFYENGCKIYPVRPVQCKTFPFWMKIFRSETNFNQVKKQCPGIGRGKFFTKADILDLIRIF